MVSAVLQNVAVRRRGQAILGPVTHQLSGQGTTLIMGPNGAGKSTLLRALHGMMRHHGTITWQGDATRAIVFQRPILLRRSVAQNLAYPLQLSRLPKAQIEQATADWAGRIGLAGALDRYAPRLSGGEQQKLALARALITQPKVLLLDEPCAALDPSATREIEALLTAAAAAGTRILMATHDLGQARRLATDVIVLRRGQVLETGPAPTIFTAPERPQTAAFFAGEIVE
ncbi:MAG: ATP-binding cassette domain-containing protein [Pseudomonadota bacterium]